MNTRILPALLATASLLLAGCLPESKNPLSTPANSTIDSRLEGIYSQRRENAADELGGWHFHYHGLKAGPNGQPRTTPWLEVLGVSHVKDGGLKGDAYRALTTHIGVHDYMSFFELGAGADKGRATLYSFARYEVNWAGDLRVWLANSEAFAQAIKSGKLRGEIKSSQATVHTSKDKRQAMTIPWSDDVLITDSTEHLAAFIASSDPATLFSGKPMVFYRIAR